MVKRLLISQFILFIILIILNLYLYLNVDIEPPINSGEYCDTNNYFSNNCLADLPGQFSRDATFSISLAFFILFPLFYFCAELIVKAIASIKIKLKK